MSDQEEKWDFTNLHLAIQKAKQEAEDVWRKEVFECTLKIEDCLACTAIKTEWEKDNSWEFPHTKEYHDNALGVLTCTGIKVRVKDEPGNSKSRSKLSLSQDKEK